MFTELFRFHRRTSFVAAGMLVLLVPAVSSAEIPVKHPPKKAVTSAKKAAQPVKKTAKARPKRKAVKPPPVVVELPPPPDVSRMANWIAVAHDNGKLPYIVIDKHTASLFLFKANGKSMGQTPVLIGMGVGDDSSPGIGAKNLSQIGPAERTTPAGRFVAKFGRAFGHTRVLWVDYANSVALHAVITTNKKERRVARLLSPTPDDNRISFGCINVGTPFYTKQVLPLFGKTGGVVYILPDTRPLDDVFPRVRLLPYLTGDQAAQPLG